MESEIFTMHIVSMISDEIHDGLPISDACQKVKMRIMSIMTIDENSANGLIDRALDLMIELGRINVCPKWR